MLDGDGNLIKSGQRAALRARRVAPENSRRRSNEDLFRVPIFTIYELAKPQK